MNDRLIDYHAARAKGGVGLTIIELLSVHSSAYPFFIAGSPGIVEGYRKLMERVRPYDMRVFQQIGHLGNEIPQADRSEEHTSELQSLMRISYAVFCLKKKTINKTDQ